VPRKPKDKPPQTTSDAAIPGAYEGETVTRRRFMTGTVNGAGAIAAASFTLPAVGFALGPIFEHTEANWQAVGPPADFSDKQYTPKVINVTTGIGDVGKSTVYVRRFNAAIDTEKRDEYNAFIAVSTRCMHLGCPVRYVQASERFICPCHGGVYDKQGKVAGGPPVRPLDRFYTREREGLVEIGPRFSVNSELQRLSPREPGQAVDGIGKYAYPARPTARKLPGT
jgi:quinol---cytochrome c reductase iron-sulfur subunit, bacillus type